MATGISKNKFNHENQRSNEKVTNLGIDVSLTYAGKMSESEILHWHHKLFKLLLTLGI